MLPPSNKIPDSLLFRNKYFEQLYLQGKISLELVPQGTLAERLRAHAAGIPAIFTPTGASTAVEKGTIPVRYHEGGVSKGVKIPGIAKEHREFNGRRYVLEHAIAGDVAFVRAWKVDEVGNTVFRFVGSRYPLVTPSVNLSTGMQRTTSAASWQRMRSLPLSR